MRFSYNPVAALLPPASVTYAIAQNWFDENLNKNLTAHQLDCFPGATFGVKDWHAPREGSVTCLSVNMDHAAAGSTPLFAIYKNGVLLVSETIALGLFNNEFVYAPGLHTFVAGDSLDVRVTTDNAWTATNADVLVTIEVTM